jgi:hypothetical protein
VDGDTEVAMEMTEIKDEDNGDDGMEMTEIEIKMMEMAIIEMSRETSMR